MDIYEMYKNNDIISFKLKTGLEFKGNFKTRDFLGKNIIGILEGSDPELKDSYIVLSAHYDHLGIGPEINGDSIYNGLLDNAFGCAGLLELARIYSKSETGPKSSIIFLFTTGEEKGMLGSIYYTDYPLKPLNKTVANINLDGLAFIDQFNSVISIGSIYSTLDDHVLNTAFEAGLIVERFPEEFIEDEAFNRSDQIAFAKAGVPSCMIIDGTLYKNISKEKGLSILIDYFNNKYHSPFDDLDQELNYNAAKQHLEFIYNITNSVANSKKRPIWLNKDVIGVK
jgi:Zn-dependent M28 family amino/carboxypeptidase